MDNKQIIESVLQDTKNKFIKKDINFAQAGQYHNSYVAKKVMRESLPFFIERTEKIVDKVKTSGQYNKIAAKDSIELLELLGIDTCCFVAVSTILAKLFITPGYNSLAIEIGNKLQQEYTMTQMKEIQPKIANKITKSLTKLGSVQRVKQMLKKSANDVVDFTGKIKYVDRKVLNIAGVILLESFIGSTGLLKVHKTRVRKKHKRILKPTETLLDFIKEFNDTCLFMFPTWRPLTQPPLAWTNVWSGGFEQNVANNPLVKTSSQMVLNKINESDLSQVYSAVNKIQNTPYRVNYQVLNVLKAIVGTSEVLGDLVGEQFAHTIPPYLKSYDDDKKQHDNWSKIARNLHALNNSNLSKKIQQRLTIQLAELYKMEKTLYFPQQLDFRGRVYSSCYFLNPQGVDYQRALLVFANSKKVTTEEQCDYLRLHGANTYGLDKKTFTERISWVLDNEKMIGDIARNPLENTQWKKAETPFQFLAFCFEYEKYLKHGLNFETVLPVQLDASNNGLQILSMLTGDVNCAKLTNVISTEDKLNDVYQAVADTLESRAKHIYNNDLEAIDNKRLGMKLLLDIGVSRKTVKRQVMVLPYGGTLTSCQDYTLEWVYEALNKLLKPVTVIDGMTNKVFVIQSKAQLKALCNHIAKEIWDSMKLVIADVMGFMRWLQLNASAVAKKKICIDWTTPLNFYVSQQYYLQSLTSIQTLINGKLHHISVSNDTHRVDVNRQKNGIVPNFVHSLDSTCLLETVNAAENINDFLMIHDSYATHCTNSEELLNITRKSYHKILSNNFTKYWEDYFKGILGDKYIPFNNSLDNKELILKELLNSPYFFS